MTTKKSYNKFSKASLDQKEVSSEELDDIIFNTILDQRYMNLIGFKGEVFKALRENIERC
ncbi:MAG: hypothetical protein ACFE95_03230 [Candidatus Hodarchaeota archaeon]